RAAVHRAPGAGLRFPRGAAAGRYLVALGEEAMRRALVEAQALRRAGLRVDLDLKGRSMKAQMREANRQRTRYAIIMGERELAEGRAVVRDMQSGQQQEVPLEELTDFLKGAVRVS
ncbi:His/Gly/Thr/Pro-type tRNA ligase C-terminal domain-containing protein, partial [Rhodothermus marinus]|uniref:His/Gly/Thr/Pro-type tRNA ligase C-terminal domain-containing protein n=1 Tax=Rhodothermus marinus TaxID=29549 RepID=UPI001FB2A61E